MKRFAISLLTPITFRSRPRLCRILNRFATTEADSAWQLIRALDAIDDNELKSKLFHNAMEEMHHAELFGGLVAKYSDYPAPVAALPRRRLFDEAPSLAAFEAYHYVGEVDVYNQFLSYAKSAPPGLVRDTFLRIREDEDGHQDIAMAELSRLAGSNAKARALIRRVRLERAWESFTRTSKAIGDAVSTVLLSIIYVIFGAAFVIPCRRRFESVDLDLLSPQPAAAAGPRVHVAPRAATDRQS
jgi:rubrerythrin